MDGVGFGKKLREPVSTYQGSKKAAATLTPAAMATTYVTIRLLFMRATKMRKGTAD